MKTRAIDLAGVPMPPAMVGVMVLLDRSGSMSSIKDAMTAAFADFVHTQQAIKPDGMWLTLHQFDGQSYDVTYDRTPLMAVGPLGLHPRGSTPLRDSLWNFGIEARKIIDDPDDATERLLLLIITDGGENASTRRSWPEVRELMEGVKSDNCEAIWFGTTEALLEAKEEMPTTFQAAGTNVAYQSDSVGAMYVGENAKLATANFRLGRSATRSAAVYSSTTSAAQSAAAGPMDAAAINALLKTINDEDDAAQP